MRHKSVEMMNSILEYADEYYLKNRHSPSTSEIAEAMGIVKSTAYKYLVSMNESRMISYDGRNIVTNKTRKSNMEVTSAAVLGSVSCGYPQLEEEFIEAYVSLPTSMFGKGEFFILRANGESMIDAGINDGDLVVIRKQKEAKEGQIVVALIENETTLKRFYLDRKNHRVRLHPENKAMEDIIVYDCKIQGVAVHVIKALE